MRGDTSRCSRWCHAPSGPIPSCCLTPTPRSCGIVKPFADTDANPTDGGRVIKRVRQLQPEPRQAQKHHHPHQKSAKVFDFSGTIIQRRPAPVAGHPYCDEDNYVATELEEGVKQVRSDGEGLNRPGFSGSCLV